MEIKVDEIYTESGDCELGCWNSATGYKVEIDGIVYDDLMPFASCCDSTNYNPGHLLDFILCKIGRLDIYIEYKD